MLKFYSLGVVHLSIAAILTQSVPIPISAAFLAVMTFGNWRRISRG